MTAYKKLYFLLSGISLSMVSANLHAQSMASPYSVFGIGDINTRSYNRTAGMANTGYALKSNAFVLNNNPASIAGLERSFYVADISLQGKFTSYSGDAINSDNSNARDFGVKRFSLATKINGFWASNVGFRQYSTVNYAYNSTQPIEGSTSTYNTTYEGDGGLNEFYWTNGFAIGKHLAAGVKLAYITGSVNQTQTFTDATIGRAIASKQVDYYGKFRPEFGLLFNTPITKKWAFSIGGRMATNTSFSPERTLTVTEGTTTVRNETYIQTGSFKLPESYGVGLALTKNNKVTFAADYTFENWSDTRQGGTGWTVTNSHRISGGVEVSRQLTAWNQTIERRFFQFGGFLNRSNLVVNNKQIDEFGVTAGIGGSYRNMLYGIALEVGSRGTTQAKLIKENFVTLTFHIAYRDFLFSKGHKYN